MHNPTGFSDPPSPAVTVDASVATSPADVVVPPAKRQSLAMPAGTARSVQSARSSTAQQHNCELVALAELVEVVVLTGVKVAVTEDDGVDVRVPVGDCVGEKMDGDGDWVAVDVNVTTTTGRSGDGANVMPRNTDVDAGVANMNIVDVAVLYEYAADGEVAYRIHADPSSRPINV